MSSPGDTIGSSKGVCAAHLRFHLGVCRSCGGCRKCAPAASCRIRKNHVSSKIGRPKKVTNNVTNIPQRITRSQVKRKASSRKRNDGMPANNKESSRKDNNNNDSDNSDNSSNSSNSDNSNYNKPNRKKRAKAVVPKVQLPTKAANLHNQSTVTKKDKLEALLRFIGSNNNVSSYLRRMPANGFKEVTSSDKSLQAAKGMLDYFVTHICLLLIESPANAVKLKIQIKELVVIESAKKLKRSLAELVLKGSRNTSVVAGSVLAHCVQRDKLSPYLNMQAQDMGIFEDVHLPTPRATMSQKKFASCCATYNLLAEGEEVPKYNYTFRVGAHKISQVVWFVQESLQVKPGIIRDVILAGHSFCSLPVYERGGMNI